MFLFCFYNSFGCLGEGAFFHCLLEGLGDFRVFGGFSFNGFRRVLGFVRRV